MTLSTQALIAAALAGILGVVLWYRSVTFKSGVQTLVANPNFRRFGLVALIVAGIVFGGLEIIGDITGLPWWINLELALATAVWLGIGFACFLISLGGWASGRTVWIIMLMIWVLSAAFFFGSRVYLFGADLYQWGALYKWLGFTIIWVGVPVAFALWLLLAKVEGDRRALGAFMILALVCDAFVVADNIQYPSAIISPLSGELVVKASIHPDGTLWPVPIGASFERKHPGYRTFRELDLDDPADGAIVEAWMTYGVNVGVDEVEIRSRVECDQQKAAARVAGSAEPKCSSTGMPAMSMPSGVKMPDWVAESMGESSEFPVRVDLSNGEELTFHADLLKEAQMGSALNLLVCEANQGDKLLVRNGGVSAWMEQSNARVGVPTSLVFDHSVPSGVRTVEVRYAGRGHMMAVIGRVGGLGMSCDPGTTGYLVGKTQQMREQQAAEKAGAAGTP